MTARRTLWLAALVAGVSVLHGVVMGRLASARLPAEADTTMRAVQVQPQLLAAAPVFVTAPETGPAGTGEREAASTAAPVAPALSAGMVAVTALDTVRDASLPSVVEGAQRAPTQPAFTAVPSMRLDPAPASRAQRPPGFVKTAYVEASIAARASVPVASSEPQAQADTQFDGSAAEPAERQAPAVEQRPVEVTESPSGEAASPAPTSMNDAPVVALAGPSAAPDVSAAGVAAPAAQPVRAADEAPPLPTYRTRMPPAALIGYRLSRSGLVGTGELDWRPEAGGYTLRLEGRLPIIGTLITQISRGRFDAAGLAPERYTDKRVRRGELAANFQRSAGVISFSGQQPSQALTPGVQDRVSVMVQIAAIASAWTRPPPVGEQFQIRVVGARGDAQVWSLRYEGPQTLALSGSTVATLRFLREPKTPQDTRAEFWLDPALGHLPVRVRLTDGDGDALELLRQP